MVFHRDLSFAQQLDQNDPLRSFRDRFIIPEHKGKHAIYFLGNSLGLQPVQAQDSINAVLTQWGQLGVEGFFRGEDPWLSLHRQLTPLLAPIVGAEAHEIVAMNQLTVNLHLMLVSFYQPSGKRRKILCEAKAFPSDQYMLHTHIRQRGFDPKDIIVEVQPKGGKTYIDPDSIREAIEAAGDELALVFWGGVNYYTGQVFDMKSITTAAHSVGAKAGFDLAHAVGNVPLHLHDWNTDFACWCSYKYLNSGPGAIGGAYIHERYHTNTALNRFAGWWGNNKKTQFLMDKVFDPELTAEGWQLSTPSPILYAAHLAALKLFNEAGMEAVYQKNNLLNDYLWYLLNGLKEELEPDQLNWITPPGRNEKGCQVSLLLKNGRSVFDRLSEEGVFVDWREPDVMRLAPVALYNTFEEVWQFVQLLRTAINNFGA
jgi:kynureninase